MSDEKVESSCRFFGIAEQTYYRSQRGYGDLKFTQVHRLIALKKDKQRLRKAVSDPTIDAMILKEAIEGQYRTSYPVVWL